MTDEVEHTYDPEAILADPDSPAIHKAYAAINIRVRDFGETWVKCANCGVPYTVGKESLSHTVCSAKCAKEFLDSFA